MKTILVDLIYVFVLSNKKINQELYGLLETFPNRKILLTSASGDRFKDFGLDKMPYEVFTLANNPPKSDAKYYELMLEHFDLNKDDVVYFEHNEDAVRSARSVGITTLHYDPDKKDLAVLKKFLVDSLQK